MQAAIVRFLLLLGVSSLVVGAQSVDKNRNGGDFSTNLHPTEKHKLPAGVIIVIGAWSGASDSVTPEPEGGSVANNTYSNQYFGLTFPMPLSWHEKHKGPPPSDTGFYRLTFVTPAETYKGPSRGNIAVFAQDMFFTPAPASNALELVKFKRDHLPAVYKMELEPSLTKISGHTFSFYAYRAPEAELHWYVLATEIRCHTVEIVMTSRDTELLDSLVLDLNKMKLPAEAGPTSGMGGGEFPVCIKNYANDEHVIERVEPVFTVRRFNSVPVRIIIDKQGKIKHIHCLSAFPEQQKAVFDALGKWRFRPYFHDGKPVEVETGITFGQKPPAIAPATKTATTSRD
jgi:hypothetical protein